MSKFLYPIYKLKIKSYIKWWLYHKKAGGSGVLSEILEGFSFNLENTLNRKFKLFEIEGNSVQDGEPSPDNEVPIYSAGENGSINEKIQTRNLFDKNEITENYRLLNDGSLYSDNLYITGSFIKVLPNTKYVFNSMVGSECICEYDKNKNCTGRTIMGSGSSITTKANTYYVRISVQKSKLDIFQFEQGSTATPYVPHEEQDYSIFVQQPMRSIGDVRDCFVKKNGTWYERHYIKEFIVSQNTTINLQSINGYGIANFYMIFQDNYYDLSLRDKQLCNLFSKQTSSIATTETEGFLPTMNLTEGLIGAYIRILSSRARTVEEFKQWTNTNNLKNYYILAEPLDLPCTQAQIEVLEKLPSTYKDFTIIQSEDETPAYLKIQYYKEG